MASVPSGGRRSPQILALILALILFLSFIYIVFATPFFNFVPPTPANNSFISNQSYAEINLTMTEPNLDTFKFNWNGTNYTFYDSSLVLAMNFNNNSAIGENATKAVDISKYGNNGTIYGASNTLDNTTLLPVNQTNPVNLSHLISIPAVNFTSDFNLTISYLNNTYANETIRVYLNGSYMGNFTTVGATTTQYAYFYNILRGNFTAGAASNITYEANSTNITRSRLGFNDTQAMWAPGKFGTALRFDGVNDYVNISTTGFSNTSGTIELWVKPNWQSGDGKVHYLYENTQSLLYDDFETSESVGQTWYSGAYTKNFEGRSSDRAHSGSYSHKLNLTLTNGTYNYWDRAISTTNISEGTYLDGWMYLELGCPYTVKLGFNAQATGCDGLHDTLSTGAVLSAGQWTHMQISEIYSTTYAWYKNAYGCAPTAGSLQLLRWVIFINGAFSGGTCVIHTDDVKFVKAGMGLFRDTDNNVYFIAGNRTLSTSSANWNTFRHIAATYEDNGTASLYVNGSLMSSASNVKISYPIGTVARIGNAINGSSYSLNGTIDEVQIWNRSRSAAEIAMHYQSELQKYNATTWQFYNNITNLADRVYTYYAWANDTSGNANQTGVGTLTIDNSAPRLTLILPQNTTYPTTALSLNYTVSDVSLDKVWYLYNSQNVTLSGNTTFTALNNSQSVIYLYANDTLGRVNVTNVTFTVDTIYPQISFIASTSANNSIVNRDWIYANVSVNDTNFKNVTFILQNSTAQVNSTTFTDSTTRAINWTSLAEGAYYYNATVFDLAGNSNSTETRTITVNITPAITTVSPSNRSYVQNWAWANLTLGKAGSWCGVSLNGTAIRPLSNASATSWYLNLSIPSDGLNNVTFYCNNSIGNWANSQAVYFTTSTTPPFVSFTSAAPLPLYANYVYVNTTVNDTNPSNNLTAFIDYNRSLVGWWRLNDDPGENSTFFRDWSAYGNNGTCSGTSCPTLTSGRFGNALQFDGVNDYVDAGNATSLNPGNGDFTVEAWIKTSKTGTQYFIHKGDIETTPPNNGYLFSFTLSGSLKFAINDGSGASDKDVSASGYKDGNWHHVVGLIDRSSNGLSLYVDGILKSGPTGISAYGAINASTPLYIGAWGNPGSSPFNGTIDEVRVWNRTLSAPEIVASYDAGRYALYRIFNSSSLNNSYDAVACAQNSLGNVNQTETRTFNVTANNNTYFLIGTGNAITNTKILPDADLFYTVDALGYQANNSVNSISMKVSRGEYDPASFLINSNGNITYLNVTVSNLTYGQNTIPSGSIDIRAVKVWWQAGTNVYDPAYNVSSLLSPELLLHDDSLVVVNGTSNTIKGYNCTNCYVNISNPHGRLRSENLTRWNELEAYLAANVKPTDSDTLQPVNVTANTLKQFWITAHIPEDATPGTYTGTINLTSRNDTLELQQNTINLQVEVLPFTLENSSMEYSIYYTARLSSTPPTYIGNYKSSEQLGAEMRNMKAHGIDNPNIYQGFSNLSDYLTIRADKGFKMDKIYLVERSTTLYTGDLAAYNNTIFPFINLSRTFGYGDVYIYGSDEASGDALLAERAAFNATHAIGAKVFVACNSGGECFTRVGDLLDTVIYGASNSNSTLASQFHSVGNKIYVYNVPQMGVEQPATYRRNYGLVPQRAGYDGAMNYAYSSNIPSGWESNPWNDFDDATYRDHTMAYPTQTGVIDTIQWEGFREGVDDVRYLTTLQKYINEASRNGTGKVSDLGIQADSWINATDFSGGDLDQIRTDMITNIKNIYYALITVQSPTNQTYGTNSIWMNVTLNQTKSWCGVSIDGAANQTLTNATGNVWWLSPTIASDGLKSMKFYCNDTSDGGMSGSRTVYFTIDTTPPSVSLSLSQSSLYAGDPITISCSASDVHLSTTTLVITKPDYSSASATCGQPFSTSQTGTYTVQYSATDTLGHSASTSQTFSASSPPYSSSGGPFSSGGGSSGGSAGPSKTIVVTSNEAVENIIMNLKTRITNQFVTIARAAAPVTGPVPTGTSVYQYLNITKANFENADIETARMDFKVNKTWYSENGIALGSTALLRYDGQSWRSLPTVQTGEDRDAYLFSANTTAFSLFAITGIRKASATQPTVAVTAVAVTSTPLPQVGTPTSTVTTTPPPVLPQAPNERPRSPAVIIMLLTVLIVLGALLYMRSSRTFIPSAAKSSRQQQQNKKAATPNGVAIEGIVTSVSWNDDFDVFDGTGFISVRFSGKTPRIGDKVRATGALARRDGRQYLSASSVEEV